MSDRWVWRTSRRSPTLREKSRTVLVLSWGTDGYAVIVDAVPGPRGWTPDPSARPTLCRIDDLQVVPATTRKSLRRRLIEGVLPFLSRPDGPPPPPPLTRG